MTVECTVDCINLHGIYSLNFIHADMVEIERKAQYGNCHHHYKERTRYACHFRRTPSCGHIPQMISFDFYCCACAHGMIE